MFIFKSQIRLESQITADQCPCYSVGKGFLENYRDEGEWPQKHNSNYSFDVYTVTGAAFIPPAIKTFKLAICT